MGQAAAASTAADDQHIKVSLRRNLQLLKGRERGNHGLS
jgi:hypothetical protein